MKSKLTYALVLIMLSTTVVWAEGMYLEGITILGVKKSAYLAVDEGKVTVNEGDKVGKWRVMRIEERSVFLKTDKNETIELPLHSWLKPESEKDTVPKAEDTPALPETFERVIIPDDQVPDGYRKVRTPFGDVLVKDDDANRSESESQAKPTGDAPLTNLSITPRESSIVGKATNIPDDQVPLGYRKVRTPFGEYILKEKTEEPKPVE